MCMQVTSMLTSLPFSTCDSGLVLDIPAALMCAMVKALNMGCGRQLEMIMLGICTQVSLKAGCSKLMR